MRIQGDGDGAGWSCKLISGWWIKPLRAFYRVKRQSIRVFSVWRWKAWLWANWTVIVIVQRDILKKGKISTNGCTESQHSSATAESQEEKFSFRRREGATAVFFLLHKQIRKIYDIEAKPGRWRITAISLIIDNWCGSERVMQEITKWEDHLSHEQNMQADCTAWGQWAAITGWQESVRFCDYNVHCPLRLGYVFR